MNWQFQMYTCTAYYHPSVKILNNFQILTKIIHIFCDLHGNFQQVFTMLIHFVQILVQSVQMAWLKTYICGLLNSTSSVSHLWWQRTKSLNFNLGCSRSDLTNGDMFSQFWDCHHPAGLLHPDPASLWPFPPSLTDDSNDHGHTYTLLVANKQEAITTRNLWKFIE